MTTRIVLCADWAKSTSGRTVWAADGVGRRIYRLGGQDWTFQRVVDAASDLGDDVAVAFDVPIGVPTSYLESWPNASSFPELLDRANRSFGFFDPCTTPEEWHPAEGTMLLA